MPFHTGPNLLAIFFTVLALQALGFLFYAPQTLGKRWAKAWGLNLRKLNAKDPVPFVIAVLHAAVLAVTLDFLMRRLGWTSVGGGLRLALYVWLAFTLGSLAQHYRFAQVRTQALAIDAGHDLAQLLLAGLILGAWR